MRHVRTTIVSRHLATRGNNKILRTPPPHISSSEEISPRLTHRTLVQLRTNKSPLLKSYLHKVDAISHTSPLCPLCNTHTHDTHHPFNFPHIRTRVSPLDVWTYAAEMTALLARWLEKLAGGPLGVVLKLDSYERHPIGECGIIHKFDVLEELVNNLTR